MSDNDAEIKKHINEWLDLMGREDVLRDLQMSAMGMPVSALSGAARVNMLTSIILPELTGETMEQLFGKGRLLNYMDDAMKKRYLEMHRKLQGG